MGRPSIYSEEVAAEIMRRISAGESLVSICRDERMPCRDTVYDWLDSDAAFSDRYARARERQAHAIAEQAVEDAQAASDPQLGRLAFDARKWFAAKVAPKVYGDKQQVEHAGANGGPIVTRVIIEDERDNPTSEG